MGEHKATGVNLQVACTLARHLAWIPRTISGQCSWMLVNQVARLSANLLVRARLRMVMNNPQQFTRKKKR